MSVVLETDKGCIVDHQKTIDAYAKCTRSLTGEIIEYCIDPNLFNIHSQFKMDSQVQALNCVFNNKRKELLVTDTDEINSKPRRKRKKKRKGELNTGEVLAQQFHEKIRQQMVDYFEELIIQAENTGYFNMDCERGDNNNSARKAAEIKGPGDSLMDLCTRETIQCEEYPKELSILSGVKDYPYCSVVNTLCHYKNNEPMIASIGGQSYILPPKTSFLLSDIQQLHRYKHSLGKFDLVVLDPPWFNKSVKRLKKYERLSNENLYELPVKDLTCEGGLVAVWVTNRQKHVSFILEELFPLWSIEYLAHWIWIKVTRTGEMVYDFDNSHKKPYESLILGRRKSQQNIHLTPECKHSFGTEQNEIVKDVPSSKVIISVPCALHSKKPPLNDVLKSFLPSDARCLELFARNLVPGWTGWGNEVLLHQHLDFFKPLSVPPIATK